MITIDRSALEAALAHLIDRAREREEGVGVLAGPIACPHDTDGDGDCGRPGCPDCPSHLATWLALANVSEYPRLRYEVDPAALLTVYEALEAVGARPHVMVHSHLRGGALPSPTDVRYATNPALLHMIVDLEGQRPAPVLWRIKPDAPLLMQTEKVRFQVVDLGEQKNQPTDLTHGVTDA